jgi:flagellar hook-length control protein FliK
MESAPSDVEMIANATLDAAESPVQPLREPSITTINRLTAFASLERTAVAPVASSANSSESGIGNAANGLAMPAQSLKAQSPSAQAASLFKALAPEMDKFKQTGASQIQLDLPVGEKESVRIKLSIRGGEIRSTFITESPELREALQKAWPEFSQNSRDRGFRMGDPAFQQSFQENNANLDQNNRRQSDTGFREVGELFSPVATRKPTSQTNTVSKANSTALWA